MKRTICALLAALVGVFAFTGATILNGRVDTHAVDVAHAVPVVASAGLLQADAAADTALVPYAARFSALVSAAAITALEDMETAEDAAANNSDLKQAETKKVETKEVKEEEPAQEEKKPVLQPLDEVKGEQAQDEMDKSFDEILRIFNKDKF